MEPNTTPFISDIASNGENEELMDYSDFSDDEVNAEGSKNK